jgi:hypothetical protein
VSRISRVLLQIVLTISFAPFLVVANAQTPPPVFQKAPPPKSEPKIIHHISPSPPSPQVKRLDRQVDIPNMPAYPGKTLYRTGHVLEGDTATTYSMNFLTTDKPEKVRDWYNSAMNGYNWNQTMAPSKTKLGGMDKSGNLLRITVGNTNVPTYQSSVTITYAERRKQR